MKSQFKSISLPKKLLKKIIHKKWTFSKGYIPLILFYNQYRKISMSEDNLLTFYTGKQYIPLPLQLSNSTNIDMYDNFFFSKNLKLGNFYFRKRHCVFRVRKKK